jgi:antitoxin PrlF
MKYSTLTSKGQVTIPFEIREKLELTIGSKLEFIIQDDFFIVLPINKSIKALSGILPKPKKALSIDEMNEVIQGVQ